MFGRALPYRYVADRFPIQSFGLSVPLDEIGNRVSIRVGLPAPQNVR